MAVASTHFFLSDEYFLAGLCGSFEPPLAPPVIQRKSMVKNLNQVTLCQMYVLILASINPQYQNRLFIELRV